MPSPRRELPRTTEQLEGAVARAKEAEGVQLPSEEVRGARHDGGRSIVGRSTQRHRLSRRQGWPAPSSTHEDHPDHRRRLLSRRKAVGDSKTDTEILRQDGARKNCRHVPCCSMALCTWVIVCCLGVQMHAVPELWISL